MKPRLQGYRLVDGQYVRLELVNDRLHSKQLGLDLVQQGEIMRLFDPQKGGFIPDTYELSQLVTDRRRSEAAGGGGGGGGGAAAGGDCPDAGERELMIIVMQEGATEAQVREVEGALEEWGYEIHPIYGVERTVIAAVGKPTMDEGTVVEQVESLPAVDRTMLILKPYRFASREYRPEKSTVTVDGVVIGGDEFIMMAGPCTVESEEQLMTTARAVKAAGARILRGGAFKPSTSPTRFRAWARTA